jgi:hypothetical protein
MAPRILIVSDRPDNLVVASMLLGASDCEIIGATLAERYADEQHPFIGDVLEKLKKNGTRLDGILLYDPSLPRNSPAYPIWVSANKQLTTLDHDMEHLRPQITAETNDDPVAFSTRWEELQRDMDKTHAEHVAEVRTVLVKGKAAAESFLTRHPPSQKGIDLIRTLHAPDSPYRDVPLVVDLAYPDRKEQLLEAGATRVNTTADPINIQGPDLLMELISPSPSTAAARIRMGGPRSPRDQARNPRGGNWPTHPDH